MELKDMRPKEPELREERSGTAEGGLRGSVLEAVRSRAAAEFCWSIWLLVSTVGLLDHLVKRGVVGREEAGEDVSETESVRERAGPGRVETVG